MSAIAAWVPRTQSPVRMRSKTPRQWQSGALRSHCSHARREASSLTVLTRKVSPVQPAGGGEGSGEGGVEAAGGAAMAPPSPWDALAPPLASARQREHTSDRAAKRAPVRARAILHRFTRAIAGAVYAARASSAERPRACRARGTRAHVWRERADTHTLCGRAQRRQRTAANIRPSARSQSRSTSAPLRPRPRRPRTPSPSPLPPPPQAPFPRPRERGDSAVALPRAPRGNAPSDRTRSVRRRFQCVLNYGIRMRFDVRNLNAF